MDSTASFYLANVGSIPARRTKQRNCMKLFKLNRRYTQFKHGHTVGFRFDSWSEEAHKVERIVSDLTGTRNGYDRKNSWYSYFGHTSKISGSKPYFITMRDESLPSAVLLKL